MFVKQFFDLLYQVLSIKVYIPLSYENIIEVSLLSIFEVFVIIAIVYTVIRYLICEVWSRGDDTNEH